MNADATESQTIVPESELFRFVVRAMEKIGARTSYAEALAHLVVAADRRGHYSHGLNRLDYYLSDVAEGYTRVDTEPEILKQTPATAHVEGNNCLGPVVGTFCMDLAIEKAKNVGIGWVCAKGSNHFGICGWYSFRAMRQGLIGMAFTNTGPNMNPTRSKERVLGTNPICVGAPAENGEEFMLDMATTAVSVGKIELKRRLEKPIPTGWGMDNDGKPTTNPDEVLLSGGLFPLGGEEETSGYKGYGLAMMVEVFCGILAGSAFGNNIRKWNDPKGPANLGHCFVAIDPNVFAPGFEGRMSELMHQSKGAAKVDDEIEILVPGEPERNHEKLCSTLGGIPYPQKQMDFVDQLAKEYGIDPMKRL